MCEVVSKAEVKPTLKVYYFDFPGKGEWGGRLQDPRYNAAFKIFICFHSF